VKQKYQVTFKSETEPINVYLIDRENENSEGKKRKYGLIFQLLKRWS